MNRIVALFLSASLSLCGADFAILNLKVVEGEGTVYAPGSRATRGVTVLVTDETGRPVPSVAVSFRLPENGPSGVFESGARTEIITTRNDGQAAVWGMRWNKLPGTLQIRITAAKDGVRAGVVSTQYLSETEAATPGGIRRGGHSKLLVIGLVVAGAAGGGFAMMARGSKTSAATPAAVTLSIGPPRVSVGAP